MRNSEGASARGGLTQAFDNWQVFKRWLRLLPTIALMAIISAFWVSPARGEWQTFGPPDGLAGSIDKVLVTRTGEVWVSTYSRDLYGDYVSNGVSRYDGLRWTSHLIPDLWGPLVHEMHETPDGSMWCFLVDPTDFLLGASRFDGTNWRHFARIFPQQVTIVGVEHDTLGHIWAAANSGEVAHFDGIQWQQVSVGPERFRGHPIHKTATDSHGNVWLAFDVGLLRYDGSTWIPFDYPGGQVMDRWSITALLGDRRGRLWLVSSFDVDVLEDGTWTTFPTSDGLPLQALSVCETSDGVMWCATYSGAARLDGSTWKRLTSPGGPGRDEVRYVGAGRPGDVWFVGIAVSYRFDGLRWERFDALGHGHRPPQPPLSIDSFGNVWLASDRQLVRYDGVDWDAVSEYQELQGTIEHLLHEDRDGGLWFKTTAGIGRCIGDSCQLVTSWGGSGRSVFRALETRTGEHWFASRPAGPNGDTLFAAMRYRNGTVTIYNCGDSLSGRTLRDMVADSLGNVWFATDTGIARYDGIVTHFTAADGLPNGQCSDLLASGNGMIAIMGVLGYPGDLYRFVDDRWFRMPTLGAFPDCFNCDCFGSLTEDTSGAVWMNSGNLLSRFNAGRWETFTLPHCVDGPALGKSTGLWASMYSRREGWTTHGEGIAHFDGSMWRAEPFFNAKAASAVLEDRSGSMWFVSGEYPWSPKDMFRLHDGRWKSYPSSETGIHYFNELHEDRTGGLWVNARDAGLRPVLFRHLPDRVPPRPVILLRPPALSASRLQSAAATAAFGEKDVEYAFSLDGKNPPAASWSHSGSWIEPSVSDGEHELYVHARDLSGNIGTTHFTFEVDATPPSALISSPSFGQAIRGTVDVRGTAADPKFDAYQVHVRQTGATHWIALTPLVPTPMASGSLVTWDTTILSDGDYDLRLTVSDKLGLVGTAQVTVIVDNEAPFADVTAPARVTAATGGDIFTTNSDMHLYFPPHAFGEDAVVTIVPTTAPATLSTGATVILPGYLVAWGAVALAKPATLAFSTAGIDPGSYAGTLVLYTSADGTTWRRLGGTIDADAMTVRLATTDPGRYALYVETSAPGADPTLSALSFTPRVFSPTGGFADHQVGIGFTLGQAGSVTVRVYNRAGWLVREVASGMTLNPGANLVRWDGRDRVGAVVADGLYLVSVEALGRTQTKALAVVR